jgi:hypothetical protein
VPDAALVIASVMMGSSQTEVPVGPPATLVVPANTNLPRKTFIASSPLVAAGPSLWTGPAQR